MSEEKSNVPEEVQGEAVVEPNPNPLPPEPSEVSPEAEETSDKEKNFSRLRETKEQLEKENRDLKDAIIRYKAPADPPKEEDPGIADDDLVEGKAFKKLHRELKALKTSYEEEKLNSIPDKLSRKFSDFNQVVTPQNIETLKTSEPELYASLTAGPDLYANAVAAYKTVKALGISKDETYKNGKDQVAQNHAKPMSTQALRGQGALSEANMFAKGLTPELKTQLANEMREAAKAY